MLFLCITLTALALAFGQKSQDISSRITGGSDTTIEQHPYQLAIELYGKQDCGASLLKPNLALTAAHCAVVNTDLMRIRAGSTTAERGGQLVEVSDKHLHPKYKTSGHDYDVAVLILKTPLVIGGGVQTIPLQAIGAEIPDGTMGTITGWGDLTDAGPPATTLQYAHVPKINQQTCINDYPNKITDRMFCFGYQDQGGVDPCVGDSGGPLVVSGKQVGITSWGESCGVPRQPGVYIKISNKEINDFITQYM